jgi:hypothetical protein
MMTEDLRAAAIRIVEQVARERPAVAAVIASLVMSELLSIGLFGGEPDEVSEFAAAVNFKLTEIALRHGADRGWQLVPTEPPKRH